MRYWKLRKMRIFLSKHEMMYQGQQKNKFKVFPVRQVMSEVVRKEWADPEKKPFFAASLEVSIW